MKFIIEENGIDSIVNYPRGNDKYMEPLEGKHNLKIYVIIENPLKYNSDYEYIQKSEIRKTKENYEGLNHLLIAYQDYKIVKKDIETIVIELDRELGGYLDSTYPQWQRDKHLREIALTKSTGKRLQYLKDLDAWMDSCRAQRDIKEQQIINNERPSLTDWPQKPFENI